MEDELNNIISDYNSVMNENEQIDIEVSEIHNIVNHRIKICDETANILDSATKEYSSLTSIFNKKDIPFFIFSILLQCGMKLTIKYLRELSDKELAKKTPGHKEEHSNRSGRKYYATKEEIATNPVPFDTSYKEHTNEWYKEHKIQKPGFSGFNHRTTAIGHDPLLGLIFGTANIMTSTITRNDFISWHVETMGHKRTYNERECFVNLDTISSRASTLEIFLRIKQRLEEEGSEGWLTLGFALMKEIVHLSSDLPSRQSLPLPIISTFNPQLAQKLSFYGLNTGTIVQGGFATKVINWMIGFLHGLAKSKNEDEKLYKVRTQKIIMYSDLFSTISDLGYSLFTAYMGDKNTMRKFDLGGYIVTLNEISHNSRIISAIEREFYTKKIIESFNKNLNNG